MSKKVCFVRIVVHVQNEALKNNENIPQLFVEINVERISP